LLNQEYKLKVSVLVREEIHRIDQLYFIH